MTMNYVFLYIFYIGQHLIYDIANSTADSWLLPGPPGTPPGRKSQAAGTVYSSPGRVHSQTNTHILCHDFPSWFLLTQCYVYYDAAHLRHLVTGSLHCGNSEDALQ